MQFIKSKDGLQTCKLTMSGNIYFFLGAIGPGAAAHSRAISVARHSMDMGPHSHEGLLKQTADEINRPISAILSSQTHDRRVADWCLFKLELLSALVLDFARNNKEDAKLKLQNTLKIMGSLAEDFIYVVEKKGTFSSEEKLIYRYVAHLIEYHAAIMSIEVNPGSNYTFTTPPTDFFTQEKSHARYHALTTALNRVSVKDLIVCDEMGVESTHNFVNYFQIKIQQHASFIAKVYPISVVYPGETHGYYLVGNKEHQASLQRQYQKLNNSGEVRTVEAYVDECLVNHFFTIKEYFDYQSLLKQTLLRKIANGRASGWSKQEEDECKKKLISLLTTMIRNIAFIVEEKTLTNIFAEYLVYFYELGDYVHIISQLMRGVSIDSDLWEALAHVCKKVQVLKDEFLVLADSSKLATIWSVQTDGTLVKHPADSYIKTQVATILTLIQEAYHHSLNFFVLDESNATLAVLAEEHRLLTTNATHFKEKLLAATTIPRNNIIAQFEFNYFLAKFAFRDWARTSANRQDNDQAAQLRGFSEKMTGLLASLDLQAVSAHRVTLLQLYRCEVLIYMLVDSYKLDHAKGIAGIDEITKIIARTAQVSINVSEVFENEFFEKLSTFHFPTQDFGLKIHFEYLKKILLAELKIVQPIYKEHIVKLSQTKPVTPAKQSKISMQQRLIEAQDFVSQSDEKTVMQSNNYIAQLMVLSAMHSRSQTLGSATQLITKRSQLRDSLPKSDWKALASLPQMNTYLESVNKASTGLERLRRERLKQADAEDDDESLSISETFTTESGSPQGFNIIERKRNFWLPTKTMKQNQVSSVSVSSITAVESVAGSLSPISASSGNSSKIEAPTPEHSRSQTATSSAQSTQDLTPVAIVEKSLPDLQRPREDVPDSPQIPRPLERKPNFRLKQAPLVDYANSVATSSAPILPPNVTSVSNSTSAEPSVIQESGLPTDRLQVLNLVPAPILDVVPLTTLERLRIGLQLLRVGNLDSWSQLRFVINVLILDATKQLQAYLRENVVDPVALEERMTDGFMSFLSDLNKPLYILGEDEFCRVFSRYADLVSYYVLVNNHQNRVATECNLTTAMLEWSRQGLEAWKAENFYTMPQQPLFQP